MKQNDLQQIASDLWFSYGEIWPELHGFACPTVKINNRYTRTGGTNLSEQNLVQLSGKFLVNNELHMLAVTLPHELAHQIDYNLNGWNKGDKHHRQSWKTIMVKIGLPPNLYHDMVL